MIDMHSNNNITTLQIDFVCGSVDSKISLKISGVYRLRHHVWTAFKPNVFLSKRIEFGRFVKR